MVTLFAVAFWTIAAGIVGSLVSGSFGVICAVGVADRVHLLVCSGSWRR